MIFAGLMLVLLIAALDHTIVDGDTPTQSGLRILPMMLGVLITAIASTPVFLVAAASR